MAKVAYIDLYLPEHKLAIECDEKHHLDELNMRTDMFCTQAITDTICCSFFRFDPFEDHFDILAIINKLFTIY